MSVQVSYGIGNAGTAGDGVLVVAPKNARYNGTMRGVLYHHGRNGTAVGVSPYVDPVFGPHLQAIAEAGYIVVAIDDSGNLWSNATAMTNMTAVYNWMTTTLGCKTGSIALYGYSMGGLTVLNWLKRNPTLVTAVMLSEPAVDLNAMEQNASFQSEILSAYGATTGTWATQSAGFNPLADSASGAYSGLGKKIAIRHIVNDAVTQFTATQQFITNANDVNITLSTVPTGLHAQAGTYWSPSDTAAFFAANA